MDRGNFVLDRFEGEYAILIDDKADKLDVLRADLPEDVREGDSISFDGISFSIDNDATQKRKDDIKSRFDRLKKRRGT